MQQAELGVNQISEVVQSNLAGAEELVRLPVRNYPHRHRLLNDLVGKSRLRRINC